MYEDGRPQSGRAPRRDGRPNFGQHQSRRPADDNAKPGSDFWDRIARGNNTTKIGASTNPREVASQIAAQARAAVDCPILQCLGPPSINQAIKAIAIARTYLAQSDQTTQQSAHPDLTVSPEFIKVDTQPHGQERDEQLSAVQLVISKRARRPSVDKEGRSLKVSKDTEAKSLAGAIASCTREGSRIELTAIGAGSVNQAIKAIAIARQFVEEEAIDLCCRPEFVEIADETGDGGASMSAVRLIVLVEQC